MQNATLVETLHFAGNFAGELFGMQSIANSAKPYQLSYRLVVVALKMVLIK